MQHSTARARRASKLQFYNKDSGEENSVKLYALMLTGRESLIRLIGKRRRFLPNHRSILSAPVQCSLNLLPDENGGITSIDSGSQSSYRENDDFSEAGESERKMAELSGYDRVTCPVCESQLRGGDYIINSHLDACLSRRTKRKLIQTTLHQLFVGSRSKAQICSTESEQAATGLVLEGASESVQNTACGFLKFENVEDDCRFLLASESVEQTDLGCSTESPMSMADKIPSLSMDKEMKHVIGDKPDATLDTFIVGRKFGDQRELNLGENISVLREPDNIKDSNAIKVLSADSACGKVIGYLPRELAQYLSPLIEKYYLRFEGCVTAIPKRSHDDVPIRLVCHKVTLDREKEFDDFEVFKNLWQKTLQVAENLKNCSPKMTKYQQNFLLLVQEVLRSNSHLFTDDEKKFMDSFTSLSEDSQRLFLRLYTRKGRWFRLSTISYPEILNSQEAIKELSAVGYIYPLEDMGKLHDDDMKNILCLLTVSELRDIFSMLIKNRNRGLRKQHLIASIFSYFQDGSCPHLPGLILEKTGICVRISLQAESLIWRTERLFFLNGEQDMSVFVIVDLGIVKYPTYNCMISEQIFSDRSDLLAYEEAIEVAQIMDQSLDEDNIESVLKCIMIADSQMTSSSRKAIWSETSESATTFVSCFSASWVYSKVVSLGISFLEREHRYTDAAHLLKRLLSCFPCDGRRGYWTVRLSINLEHKGCLNESLSVAETGLLDPWVRAGSRVALQRRVLRLAKPPRRWKTPCFSELLKRKITEVHVQGRPLNCKTGTKSRFYGEDGEQCGVEELALKYYAGEGGGWQGVHTETGIWLTLFSILLWDIIFSDVPNVFRTRYQTAPLDLESDSFYLARKNLIESQLQKIYDGMAEEILICSWESHVGTVCKGVDWDRHSLVELRAAVTCIGGPPLAALCRLLAQDYRSWSSGMPDLLLWRFHGDYRGEAKLVEVKGPGDRLSEQQRAWLLLLMDCGFNTEVCKVSPAPITT